MLTKKLSILDIDQSAVRLKPDRVIPMYGLSFKSITKVSQAYKNIVYSHKVEIGREQPITIISDIKYLITAKDIQHWNKFYFSKNDARAIKAAGNLADMKFKLGNNFNVKEIRRLGEPRCLWQCHEHFAKIINRYFI